MVLDLERASIIAKRSAMKNISPNKRRNQCTQSESNAIIWSALQGILALLFCVLPKVSWAIPIIYSQATTPEIQKRMARPSQAYLSVRR